MADDAAFLRAFANEARPIASRYFRGQKNYSGEDENQAREISARYTSLYSGIDPKWAKRFEGKHMYTKALNTMYIAAVGRLAAWDRLNRFADSDSEEWP